MDFILLCLLLSYVDFFLSYVLICLHHFYHFSFFALVVRLRAPLQELGQVHWKFQLVPLTHCGRTLNVFWDRRSTAYWLHVAQRWASWLVGKAPVQGLRSEWELDDDRLQCFNIGEESKKERKGKWERRCKRVLLSDSFFVAFKSYDKVDKAEHKSLSCLSWEPFFPIAYVRPDWTPWSLCHWLRWLYSGHHASRILAISSFHGIFIFFPTKHAEASKCSVMLFAMAMGVKRVLAKPTRKNRGRIGEFKQSDSQWSSTDVIGGLAVRGASQGPRVTACHEAYVQGRSSQGQRSRQLSPTPVARNLRSQKQNEAKKQDVKWIEIPFRRIEQMSFESWKSFRWVYNL